MNGPLPVPIDLEDEKEVLIALEYTIKKREDIRQRAFMIDLKISTLQRKLLSLQRKRILSESPEEKRIRLLMIKTGLPEDEIRKGLELIGKD